MKYFTIKISERVGFTDQLNQIFFLYKIGELLGLEYLHSGVSTKRTSGDIWSDLMLEAQFEELSEYAIAGTPEFLDLAVVDRRTDGGHHGSLDDLIAALKLRIAAEASPQTVLRLALGGDRNPVLNLLTSLPHGNFQGFRDRIGRAFSQVGWSSPFSAGTRLKVLVHIRKGDTARIGMPWGDDLALWHREAAISPKGQSDDLAIFRAIVRSLSDRFAANDIEIAVFSDGFERSRQVIGEALADDPYFGRERMAHIDHLLTEKEAELSLFAQIPRTQCFVGEGYDSFKRLLIGIREADLVIANGSQRLSAKLLGTLPRGDGPRALAVVGWPEGSHFYYKDCLVSEEQCHFIPISWEKFSLAPVVDFLIDRVSSGQKRPLPEGADLLAGSFGPYNYSEWEALGSKLVEENRIEPAHAAYQEYARLTDNCDDSLRRLADILAKSGDESGARVYRDMLERRAEARRKLLIKYPDIQWAMGRHADALAEIELLKKQLGHDASLEARKEGIEDLLSWLSVRGR